MKKMLIAGNWKMNCNTFEATVLVEYIWGGIINRNLISKILVCPPFTSLEAVRKVLEKSNISVGAQNCYYESKGAYTGEISIPMIAHLGAEYIIIGHSERRSYFNESNELINKKLLAIHNAELKPILCIGETLAQRQAELTFEILTNQLDICLKGFNPDNIDDVVIAYEPVWAIGTGIAATTEQIIEAHEWLRNYFKQNYNEKADNMILLYGGSMNAKNADSILSIEDVNGGLIGGASINPEEFLSIIDIAEKILAE
jgi:triosephosphate isomerase